MLQSGDDTKPVPSCTAKGGSNTPLIDNRLMACENDISPKFESIKGETIVANAEANFRGYSAV